jgi:RNA polymerase sigma-70 factor, ECF subfamily
LWTATDTACRTGPLAVSTPDPQPSDAELVAALPREARTALAVLYDRYAGLVYGLALKVLASPAEAEDLTQEVFLTLARASTYDPARGTLSAYLVTFTRSRAIDRLRFRSRSTRLLERWGSDPAASPAHASPLEELDLQERTERVRAALVGLPEMQRRVLELAYFKGLSQTEIAAELDAPLGTVKTWSRKGLLSLRAILGERMA